MADRIQVFNVTTPAGTLTTAPLTTPLTFTQGQVVGIEVQVPAGPSGLLGFRFTHSGTVVIPYEYTDWIIVDNHTLSWPISNKPTGQFWGLESYNIDVYDHTIYIRFLVDEIAKQSAPQSAQLVPIIQTLETAVG